MGGIIDTSVFIFAERQGSSALELVDDLLRRYNFDQIAVPTVVISELVQGVSLAKTDRQRHSRRAFLASIEAALPLIDVNREVAWIAGELRGDSARVGNTLPPIDTLIAACALHLGFSVVTLNVSDFQRIAGLHTLEFKRL